MSPPADPPPDRFCDLVMKGGIASGVTYPPAIAHLARHYHFKSIGGTSVGAIAASITAAAELQRATTGDGAGFALIGGLPEALCKATGGSGHSKLRSLFQPAPSTRRLFRVLMHSLNSEGTYRRIGAVVAGILLAYWPAVAACVAAAAAIGLSFPTALGLYAAVLSLLVALVLAVGAWLYHDLTRGLVRNRCGLCTGMPIAGEPEALVPWLHRQIQHAAGRAEEDDPVTFGDLWGARGGDATGKGERGIDLRMFSTSLTHGRPYLLPLQADAEAVAGALRGERLYFRREELAAYLPERVLDWMCEKAGPTPRELAAPGGEPFRELPPAAQLPILFAARLSLSFPILFAAVPLWAPDTQPAEGVPRLRPCWFSDGGISSNFPMHLFDGLVPRWPTFGIDLEDQVAPHEPTVFLPQRYEEGIAERWNAFAEDARPASLFGGFLLAIAGAAQNWNDNLLARMPGFRDRVARVRLAADEGGLNLDMTKPRIEAVARKGARAGEALVARFASAVGGTAPGWDEHRFVRLNVLLSMLAARAPALRHALAAGLPYASDFAALLRRAGTPPPPAGYDAPLAATEQRALADLIGELERLAQELAAPGHALGFAALPRPELRVRPPI